MDKPTEKADQSSLLRVQDDMEGKIADHSNKDLEKITMMRGLLTTAIKEMVEVLKEES